MTLDWLVLRMAKPENLERLALNLGLRVPPLPRSKGGLGRWAGHVAAVIESDLERRRLLDVAGAAPDRGTP